jgi:hypothetical protein
MRPTAGSVSKHRRTARSVEFAIVGDWVRHAAHGLGRITQFTQAPKPIEVRFVDRRVA